MTNGDHKEEESAGSRRSSSPFVGRTRGESLIKLQKMQQLISVPILDHKVECLSPECLLYEVIYDSYNTLVLQ